MKEQRKTLPDLSLSELRELIAELSQPGYRAGQLMARVLSGCEYPEMTDLPKTLLAELSERYAATAATIKHEKTAKDGTVKFLMEMLDGQLVESVFMRQSYGTTLCVSTQAGCRMGCRFCASGLNGLCRNLTAGEILAEVIAANRYFGGGRDEHRAVTNLVLMGSGEPLDNYDETTKFLRLITDKDGFNFSSRNISLSTCGLPDGIKRLADDGFSVTLSLSLHATTDETRRRIMPIAERFSIHETLDAVRYYQKKTGRRVHIEYAMMDGLNTNHFDAQRLQSLLKGIDAHINLIPLNPVPERNLKSVTKETAARFLSRLRALNLNATPRTPRGQEITGACGQLRNKFVGDLKGKNTPK